MVVNLLNLKNGIFSVTLLFEKGIKKLIQGVTRITKLLVFLSNLYGWTETVLNKHWKMGKSAHY